MHAGGAGVRLTHHLGDARPQLARRAQLRDRHELVVVGGIAETDLPQRIRHRDATFSEQPQVCDRGRDAAGQFPRRAGTHVVECRAIDGDSAHSAAVSADFRGGRHDVGHARGRPPAHWRGQWVGAEVQRQPGALILVQIGQEGQQHLRGGDIVGAGFDHQRHQVDEHTVEQPVQLSRRHTLRSAHAQHQRVDPLGQGDQNVAIGIGRRGSVGGKGFGHLPAGLDVAQRVTAPHVGPPPGQRWFRQRVQAGVQRSDRETLVGRRIQQPLRFSGQVRPVAPRALRQHSSDRGAPPIAIGLDDAGTGTRSF